MSTLGEDRMVQSSPTPFVGRKRELSELSDALDDAVEGNGRIVLLSGEPGIGKTRLTLELAKCSQRLGAAELRGDSYQHAGAPPYWAWRHAVRTADGAFSEEEFRTATDAAGPNAVKALRELAPHLSAGAAPDLYDPSDSQFQVLAAAAKFFTSLSDIKPVLLVLEDLQRADRATLHLLEFIASEIRNKRVLIVGTFIDSEIANAHPLNDTLALLQREQNCQRINMSALTSEDARELAATIVSDSAPNQLLDTIERVTGRNPFFITELAKGLIDSSDVIGVDDLIDGRMLKLPDTIQASVSRRVRNLSADAHRLLRLAAVLERDFNPAIIEALDPELSGKPLLHALDEVVRRGLVVAIRGERPRYKLAHDLLAMALLGTMDSSVKTELHAHFAEVLAEYYGHPTDEHAAEIAEHCVAAENLVPPDLTAKYALYAGNEALLGRAYNSAIRWFNIVLDPAIARHIDREMVASAHQGAGQALAPHVSVAHKQPAWNHLVSSFELYLELGETEKALTAIAHPIAFGRLAGTSDVLQRAVALARELDSKQLGTLLVAWANAMIVEVGDWDAVWTTLDEARLIAEQTKDKSLLVQVELSSTICAYYAVDPERAIDHGQVAERLADEIGTASVVSRLAFFLANSLAVTGRHQEALAVVEKGSAFALSLNIEHDIMHTFRARAQIHFSLGNWTQAIDAMKELRDRVPDALTTEFEWMQSTYAYEKGEVDVMDELERLRYHNLAFRALARASIHHDITPYELQFRGYSPRFESAPFVFGWKARRHASLAATLNDRVSATYYYESLRESAIRIDYCTGSTDRLLGQLALVIGRPESAEQHFRAAIDFCRDHGYRPEFVMSVFSYARMLLDRGSEKDLRAARELLTEGMRVASSIAMISMNEVLLEMRAETTAIQQKSASNYGLTIRQLQVLRLVGLGYTNGEIARELVITQNVAAHHIQNIREKVGPLTRIQLATLARDLGLLDDDDNSATRADEGLM